MNNLSRNNNESNLENPLTLNGQSCVKLWDDTFKMKRVAIINDSNVIRMKNILQETRDCYDETELKTYRKLI